MRATGRRSISAPVTNSMARGTPCTAKGSKAATADREPSIHAGLHQRMRQRQRRQQFDDRADPQVASEHLSLAARWRRCPGRPTAAS